MPLTIDRGLHDAANHKANKLLMTWYLCLELDKHFGKQRLSWFCFACILFFKGLVGCMLCCSNFRCLISGIAKPCLPLNIVSLHLHLPTTTLPSFTTCSKCLSIQLVYVTSVLVPCSQSRTCFYLDSFKASPDCMHFSIKCSFSCELHLKHTHKIHQWCEYSGKSVCYTKWAQFTLHWTACLNETLPNTADAFVI